MTTKRTTNAEQQLATMRAKAAARQARFRERHGPERRAADRKKRTVAEGVLVSRHEGEYAELLALHREAKNSSRVARAELRKRYPDEWRDILADS